MVTFLSTGVKGGIKNKRWTNIAHTIHESSVAGGLVDTVQTDPCKLLSIRKYCRTWFPQWEIREGMMGGWERRGSDQEENRERLHERSYKTH